MTYYCWHCYGRNERPSGRCEHCGEEIAPPPDVSEQDRLIWGIRHPDPDVAVISTRRLSDHPEEAAAKALRAAIANPPDPYVAREALRSLLAISTVSRERKLLECLAENGSAMLRFQAERALEST